MFLRIIFYFIKVFEKIETKYDFCLENKSEFQKIICRHFTYKKDKGKSMVQLHCFGGVEAINQDGSLGRATIYSSCPILTRKLPHFDKEITK